MPDKVVREGMELLQTHLLDTKVSYEGKARQIAVVVYAEEGDTFYSIMGLAKIGETGMIQQLVEHALREEEGDED